MKRSLGFVVGLGLLVLAGCSGPLSGTTASTDPTAKTTYHFHLQDFPEDHASYSLVIQTFSIDGNKNRTNYDNLSLGSYEMAEILDQDLALDSRSQYVALYLMDDYQNPVYFDSWLLSNLENRTLVQTYWVAYGPYFSSKTLTFGINSRSLETLSQGANQAVAFVDRPFHLYRITSDAGKTYRVGYSDTGPHPARVTQAANLATLINLSQDRVLSPSVPFNLQGQGPATYLFVRPESYEQEATLSLSYEDITSQVALAAAHSFAVNTVETLDQGATLLMAAVSGGYSSSTTELRAWDVASGTVKVLKTFADPITAMVSNGVDLYLGSGVSVYRYSPATGKVTLLWNFGGTVRSLAVLGTTHLLVDDASGAWSTFNLVKLSPFTVQATKTWVDPSRFSVWVPEQNRLYLYRDGTSPNDVCYVDIDLASGTFGTYGDSPYHGDYALGNPLLRLGSDLALVSGSGTVFRIDDTTSSKIKFWTSLGSSFTDLSFGTDRLWLLKDQLSNSWTITGTTLVSQDLTPPFAPIDSLGEWTQETGVKLVSSPEGLLVVTQKVNPSGYQTAPGEVVVRLMPSSQLSVSAPPSASRRLLRLTPAQGEPGWAGVAGVRMPLFSAATTHP